MGAPSINIAFIEKARETVARGERGTIAMILKDSAQATHVISSVSDIPASLSSFNQQQIKNALLGYDTAPKKIIVYVIQTTVEEISYTAALAYLATQKWNWLVAPTVETDAQTEAVATWIKQQRADMGMTYKAVLPNSESNDEAIVNVVNGYTYNGTAYTAEQACARVAGIICGTSTSRSCTYAPIPEASDCVRMTKTELDAAVDAGKLVFFWDGEKVKICRGVTSLTSTSANKGDSFKKIRLVEFMDMMHDDIMTTAQDNYIGKYPNTYDSKCVLVASINEYFRTLQNETVLSTGFCEIDIDKNREYIVSHGGKIVVDGQEIDVADATEQQIKEAPTGSIVYLRAVVRLVDAIEDIVLDVYIG